MEVGCVSAGGAKRRPLARFRVALKLLIRRVVEGGGLTIK